MLPRERQAKYQSYLLRLWRVDDLAPWQGSLQDTATGEVRHFAEIDSLWAFLLTAMELSGKVPPPKHDDT